MVALPFPDAGEIAHQFWLLTAVQFHRSLIMQNWLILPERIHFDLLVKPKVYILPALL